MASHWVFPDNIELEVSMHNDQVFRDCAAMVRLGGLDESAWIKCVNLFVRTIIEGEGHVVETGQRRDRGGGEGVPELPPAAGGL